jgi:hypothetical protein
MPYVRAAVLAAALCELLAMLYEGADAAGGKASHVIQWQRASLISENVLDDGWVHVVVGGRVRGGLDARPRSFHLLYPYLTLTALAMASRNGDSSIVRSPKGRKQAVAQAGGKMVDSKVGAKSVAMNGPLTLKERNGTIKRRFYTKEDGYAYQILLLTELNGVKKVC